MNILPRKKITRLLICAVLIGSIVGSIFPAHDNVYAQAPTTNAASESAPSGTVNTTADAASSESSLWGTIANYGKTFNPISGLQKMLVDFFVNAILGTMSMLVWLAGILLDYSMYLTVNMSEILERMPIVDKGWEVFRDLANMVFIFVLLYIAIATILNVGNTKKMLVEIIITALLINFSLFFTKALVDASNLVALVFYDRITDGQPFSLNSGPSAKLRNMFGVQTIYGVNRDGTIIADTIPTEKSLVENMLTAAGRNLGDWMSVLSKGVFGAITMLVAAFVIATGGFLLIIRIIVLMFLMMLSPLAFVARILPRTEKIWNKWWESLVNHAIFAPVFLAFLYIILATGQNGLPVAKGTFANLYSGAASASGSILNFVFMILLFMGALLVSKEIGIHGGSAVQGWASSASNWARNRARNAGGWAVRRTVGETARRIEEQAKVSKFGTTRVGRFLRESVLEPTYKTKLGSMSAEEQYKADRKLVESHDIAKTREEALAKIKAITTPGTSDYIQNARERNRQMQLSVAKMGKSFGTIPRKILLQNPELLQAASGAQIVEAFKNDWNEFDKTEALKKRYQPIMGAATKYGEEMKEYLRKKEVWQQYKYEEENGIAHAAPPPIGYDPAKPPEEPKFDSTSYELLRGLREGDLEYLHQAYPEIFADEFTGPVFRFSAVDYSRKSPNFAQAESETFRVTKNYPQFAAVAAANGADGFNEDFLKYTLGDRRNVMRDIGKWKFLQNKIAEGLPTGTIEGEEDLRHNRFFTRPDGKVEYQYRDAAGNVKKSYIVASSEARQKYLESRGDQLITEAFGERDAGELARTPGANRNQALATLHYGRAVFKNIQVDTKEYPEVIEPLLLAYKKMKEGRGTLSVKGMDALNWMANVKEGQEFVSKATFSREFQAIFDDVRRQPKSFWEPGPSGPTGGSTGGGTPPPSSGGGSPSGGSGAGTPPSGGSGSGGPTGGGTPPPSGGGGGSPSGGSGSGPRGGGGGSSGGSSGGGSSSGGSGGSGGSTAPRPPAPPSSSAPNPNVKMRGGGERRQKATRVKQQLDEAKMKGKLTEATQLQEQYRAELGKLAEDYVEDAQSLIDFEQDQLNELTSKRAFGESYETLKQRIADQMDRVREAEEKFEKNVGSNIDEARKLLEIEERALDTLRNSDPSRIDPSVVLMQEELVKRARNRVSGFTPPKIPKINLGTYGTRKQPVRERFKLSGYVGDNKNN